MVKTRMASAKYLKGFTLIELMIVIAVIGILAAIAWPNYTSYLIKSRRAAAQSDMLQIQLALEKWRANNASYRSDATMIAAGADTSYNTAAEFSDKLNFTDSNNYYDYTVTGVTGSAYTINAEPQGSQTGDTCGTLTLDQSSAKTPSACWKS